MSEKSDGAVIVVGGKGEIGRRFARAAGDRARVLGRGFRADELGPRGTPVLVCVREQQLEDALTEVPVERAEDLVFVQNGFVEETLARYPGHTRAVLWFTAKGDFFKELYPSPVAGPRAGLVEALLTATGLRGEVLDSGVCLQRAVEKAAWSCVVGPPLVAWGTDFAGAMREKRDAVRELVIEACAVAVAALRVNADADAVLRVLDETAVPIGWMKGGAHALAQRNGWVSRVARAHGLASPANDAVVRALGGETA